MQTALKETTLYKETVRRHSEIPAPAPNVLEEFAQLSYEVQQHSKYIVRVFSEYTPHDATLHLDHLFGLADRLLGPDLYDRLNATELLVFSFALYCHDWGMAVSDTEVEVLRGDQVNTDCALLPGEPEIFQQRMKDATAPSADGILAEYIRDTHGLRSGARLRKRLQHLGVNFSEAVARAAEGHALDIREIRNVHSYPVAFPVFGHTLNLAAISTYVRIIDLLDIGEDRTPYALWQFVAPKSGVSSLEWMKHGALSPVAIIESEAVPQVLIGGFANNVDVYAALFDLRDWVDAEFSSSVSLLRNMGVAYDLRLDSKIKWHLEAKNFHPILTKFEPDRESVLGLLGSELYEGQPNAFIRELLQNSVDAIDTREAILALQGAQLEGVIQVTIQTTGTNLQVEWEDNGIGMDGSILQSYFASIGRSWYRSRFFADLHLTHEPISLFGVGILSCFVVSDTLEIKTRRDPSLGDDPAGLDVQIPSPLAHFRVKEADGIPIGTKTVLRIKDAQAKGINAGLIRQQLRNVAGYVRHKILISIDGHVERVESLARGDSNLEGCFTYREPRLVLRGIQSDPNDGPLKHATIHTFAFGESTGDYEGYYSALIPNSPTEMAEGGYREWLVGDIRIDMGEFVHNATHEVFVKGIRVADPKAPLEGHRHLASAGSSEWPGPKIAVNLPKASAFKPSLSRASTTLVDDQWQRDMWLEISDKLGTIVFPDRAESLESSAVALGVANLFGGIPQFALNQMVSAEDAPILVLRAGNGLVCVPSRGSGVRLGIEMHGRLIELMKREKLEDVPIPLSKEDFYPGTVGRYRNPYHYDLRAWKQVGSGIGTDLS